MTIVPLAPTAQQAPDTQAIPYKPFVVPDVCETDVDPVVVLAMIVPPAPTLQHELDDGHETASSWLLVPEVSEDQLEPVFVLSRIVPLAPTA